MFMTMHMCGPALSLNGKKKGKVKFRNAAEAQRARELDTEWKELLKRQGVEAEKKKQARAMKAEPLVYKLETPVGRTNTHHIPSRVTAGHDTTPNVKVYTGTEIIGVTVLHKSCLQPVFNQQQAIDAASMRR
jgi:hypothetical protein